MTLYSMLTAVTALPLISSSHQLFADMRLIHTSLLTFKEFDGGHIPSYAILSHRWASEQHEVSYKDFKKQLNKDKSGYEKISAFCKKASERCEWAWIDTCCIDKRFSAELSEAINSMFSWYKNACICYAYLSDVDARDHWEGSKWWKRGWTLQELLAPAEVIFCNQHWDEMCYKTQAATRISEITRIPPSALKNRNKYKTLSVAQKMSWAAGRQTTRVEDRAYSLLGLFQINMPLLYGEGTKAFQRLQLEILQKHPDETVLAWQPETPKAQRVLAASPDQFRHWESRRNTRGIPSLSSRVVNPPRVTSWGIEIRADARRLKPRAPAHQLGPNEKFFWAVTLTRAVGGNIIEIPFTLILQRCGPAPYTYQRIDCINRYSADIETSLHAQYEVKEVENKKLFYLQFDEDLVI